MSLAQVLPDLRMRKTHTVETTSSFCRPVKVVAVASGKGGVGRTQVAANLAVALARAGRSTLLLDANLGLANIHLVLGLTAEVNLTQVLLENLPLDEVVIQGPAGLRVVPGGLGESRMADLSPHEQIGLIGAFSSLPIRPEYMVIDSPPGIGSMSLSFCAASDAVLVVLCDDIGSIEDAWALIDSLSDERGVDTFRVVCNRVGSRLHGRHLFRAFLASRADRLDIRIQHVGSIPEDPSFTSAARTGRALVEWKPSSRAARALRRLADEAEKWEAMGIHSGRPTFFAGCELS